jgi:transcriptional regulator with XRE-family HTH domain
MAPYAYGFGRRFYHNVIMQFPKVFSERLKEYRLSCFINQSELARTTGIHQPYISQFENGKRMPAPGELVSLAKGLGRHPLELVLPVTPDMVNEIIESQITCCHPLVMVVMVLKHCKEIKQEVLEFALKVLDEMLREPGTPDREGGNHE